MILVLSTYAVFNLQFIRRICLLYKETSVSSIVFIQLGYIHKVNGQSNGFGCVIPSGFYIWIDPKGDSHKIILIDGCWRVADDPLNSLNTNPKWPNTQTIRRLLPTNCLSVFDHFVRLALKELKRMSIKTF